MKLASFIANGSERYGIVLHDGLIDLKTLYPQYNDLRHFLEQGLHASLDIPAGKNADFR